MEHISYFSNTTFSRLCKYEFTCFERRGPQNLFFLSILTYYRTKWSHWQMFHFFDSTLLYRKNPFPHPPEKKMEPIFCIFSGLYWAFRIKNCQGIHLQTFSEKCTSHSYEMRLNLVLFCSDRMSSSYCVLNSEKKNSRMKKEKHLRTNWQDTNPRKAWLQKSNLLFFSLEIKVRKINWFILISGIKSGGFCP